MKFPSNRCLNIATQFYLKVRQIFTYKFHVCSLFSLKSKFYLKTHFDVPPTNSQMYSFFPRKNFYQSEPLYSECVRIINDNLNYHMQAINTRLVHLCTLLCVYCLYFSFLCYLHESLRFFVCNLYL